MKALHIGLGQYGFSWLEEILLQTEGVEVIGVVDHNMPKLEAASALPGMEQAGLYKHIGEALQSIRPEFIVNASSPDSHTRINRLALDLRIPVLCEKPIAVSYQEAEKLESDFRVAKLKLMINENYRYNWLFRTAKRFLNEGRIGRLNKLSVDFYRCHRLLNYLVEMEHPLLLDVAIHHLDCLRYLIGREATSVFAHAWKPKWSWYKANSNVSVLMEFGDIHASYRGSLDEAGKFTDWKGDWRIEGEKAMMELTENHIVIHTEEGSETFRPGPGDEKQSRHAVLREFLDSLRENRPGETDIGDNLKTFLLTDGAVRSAALGQPVLFPVKD
ncbi:Gfo/Idh/MocA family protein [Gorillibacterium massiliense]|uniref:Gfo/Idh/MocA family protein n=1 Tax=Gorillibacterium massiliense TaxID=1280390 RepID=UPI0004AE8932|nr:Gfo/Idh/MocA family oxidoreductase [Gorillibacterium massiliense]